MAVFVHALAWFVQDNSHLYSLNLQGLFLGKKLLPFITCVRESKSLIEVNLCNNLLSEYDEIYLVEALGINRYKSHPDLLPKHDSHFNFTINKFKASHLNDDNQFNKGQEGIVGQFVNNGIVREVRAQKNLQAKLQLNAAVGEVIANTGSKSFNLISSEAQADKLFFRRYIGFNEFIFNELSTDNFEVINQDKNTRWHHTAPKEVSALQYVMVSVDADNLEEDFTLVKGVKERHTLKQLTGLEFGDPEQIKKLKAPLIFGTFSNWKVYQMLLPVQFAAAMVCKSEVEKNLCEQVIFQFDEKVYQSEFKILPPMVFPMIRAMADAQNAHVVGDVPEGAQNQAKAYSKTFIFSKFVESGKHSIFIYDPTTDEFYKNIIAVDLQTQSFTPRPLDLETEQP